MSTTTANMGLTVPSSGDDDYPTSISSAMTAIDTHDHTSGKGVPVGRLASSAADGSTLEVSGGAVRIKDLGVSSSKMAANSVATSAIQANAVTFAKRAVRSSGSTAALGEVAISSSGGVFADTNTSYTDVTNLSVTLTTQGGPVLLTLVAGSNTEGSGIAYISGASTVSYLAFVRASTVLSAFQLKTLSGDAEKIYPASSFVHVDAVAGGTYTYKVQMKRASGSGSNTIEDVKLVAYEL